jgi:hypothetical protein
MTVKAKTVRLTTRPASKLNKVTNKRERESYPTFIDRWVCALENRDRIRSGASISADVVEPFSLDFGRMFYHPEWLAVLKNREFNYVIKSYDTPIALWSNEKMEWIVPDVSYSRTTTRHLSLILSVLRMQGHRVIESLTELDN